MRLPLFALWAEILIDGVRIYELIVIPIRIGAITAPVIVARMFRYPCPYRIELYIAATGKQVVILGDNDEGRASPPFRFQHTQAPPAVMEISKREGRVTALP